MRSTAREVRDSKGERSAERSGRGMEMLDGGRRPSWPRSGRGEDEGVGNRPSSGRYGPYHTPTVIPVASARSSASPLGIEGVIAGEAFVRVSGKV